MSSLAKPLREKPPSFIPYTLHSCLLLSTLCFLFTFFAFKFPEPVGYVNDFANIISPDVERIITSYAFELDKKTGAQLAVVTIKSLEGLSIEDYAWRLFEEWGIGKKGEDLGVLLLVDLKERRVRIEVGYGFEGKIPDAVAGDIIREYIVPYFKKGDYSRGILLASGKLLQLMAEELGVTLSGSIPVKEERRGSPIGTLIYILLLFLFFGGRFFIFPIFFGGFGGYWGRGGGGFGGFGGFGGGLSGGGGASGSW
ncbi:MAG: YgcG family protein [Caldiserica bacterium]|nr:MAG: YgcG family protein [Caldisericota bacterium]